MKEPSSFKDFSRPGGPLAHVDPKEQIPLPPPFDTIDEEPPFADESFGYFTRLHNAYGRVYWARLGYRF